MRHRYKSKATPTRKKTAEDDEEELARLRISVEEITQSIIDLINARQKLSMEIARVKRRTGAPIENLQVESSLQKKVQDYAGGVGVDPLVASKILSLILESSKTVQRKAFYEQSIRSFLREKGIDEIAVIGAGRMGGWFGSYFTGLLHPPIVFDQDRKKAKSLAQILHGKLATNLAEAAKADLVIVAIRISDTPAMIKRLVSLSQQLSRRNSPFRILELTSVKGPLVRARLIGKDATNHSLYSVHPMFGPDAKQFAQNKMLEISENMDGDGLVRGLFPHFKICTLNAEEHDRMMSYVLSLPHLVALLFADMVANEAPVLRNYSGPSFERMLEMANKVLSESPAVYYEIQSSNKENLKMLKHLERSHKRLTSLTRNKQLFQRFFKMTNAKLGNSQAVMNALT